MNNYIINKLGYDCISGVTRQLFDLIKSKFVYSIDITGLAHVIKKDVMCRFFKNIPMQSSSSRPLLSFSDAVASSQLNITSSSYCDLTFFNKTPIVIIVESCSDASIHLHTRNNENSKKNLNRFIKHLKKLNNEFSSGSEKDICATLCGQYPSYYRNRPKRNFQNTYIAKSIREELTKTITDFKNNKDFYKKNSVPYHLGIMLYGEPGTGKSTLISTIANEFDLIPYFVEVGDIRELIHNKRAARDLFMQDDRVKMIVIEDIDASEFVKRDINNKRVLDEYEKDERDSHRIKTLSEFLNLIDGYNSLENVIWLFTTNHIEKIDPAVLRAGRVDLKYHIGYVTDETFNEFLKHHFNKEIPVNRHINDNVLFADIQLDVMSRSSFDQIVEKYTHTN